MSATAPPQAKPLVLVPACNRMLGEHPFHIAGRKYVQAVRLAGALPIVLPPTVLGFYLLLLMGPEGVVGRFTEWAGIGLLPFTFWGLVVASVFYSMPFVVQPIQNAFEAIGERPLEAAATLRAAPLDAFFSVAVPLAKPGFITASILGLSLIHISEPTRPY